MGAKRYLAIDLGERRTGLAGADSVLRTAQPLEVLQVPAGPALLDALARAVKEHGPDELVLGLPLNMDGTEGAAAARARVFAQQLAARTGLHVHLQDERLSSFEADQRMAQRGERADRGGGRSGAADEGAQKRTHQEKKELRDALAACAVLDDFLRA